MAGFVRPVVVREKVAPDTGEEEAEDRDRDTHMPLPKARAAPGTKISPPIEHARESSGPERPVARTTAKAPEMSDREAWAGAPPEAVTQAPKEAAAETLT